MIEKLKHNLRAFQSCGIAIYGSQTCLGGIFDPIEDIENTDELEKQVVLRLEIPYSSDIVVIEKKNKPDNEVFDDIFKNCLLKIEGNESPITIYIFKKSDAMKSKRIQA